MRRRGLAIAAGGAAIFFISAISMEMIIESDFSGPVGFDIERMLDDMFDEITPEMSVMPGGSERVSYVIESDDTVLLWAVHINDYEEGDSAELVIYDAIGQEREREFLAGEIQFQVIDWAEAGTLDFEIENTGREPISVVVMFSDNPDDSEMFADPNSPLNRVFVPLLVSSVFMLLGLIVSIIGVAIFLVDMKRHQQRTDRFGV